MVSILSASVRVVCFSLLQFAEFPEKQFLMFGGSSEAQRRYSVIQHKICVALTNSGTWCIMYMHWHYTLNNDHTDVMFFTQMCTEIASKPWHNESQWTQDFKNISACTVLGRSAWPYIYTHGVNACSLLSIYCVSVEWSSELDCLNMNFSEGSFHFYCLCAYWSTHTF